MTYRIATLNEIDELVELRKKQLIDEGISPTEDTTEEMHKFFEKKMSDGTMVEWVVEENNKIIATSAIVFYEFPPSFTNKSGIKGYITNMYTVPEYRGRGIASSLLNKLTDEAKARNVHKLWLGASKMGRPVYLKYGFEEKNIWLDLHI